MLKGCSASIPPIPDFGALYSLKILIILPSDWLTSGNTRHKHAQSQNEKRQKSALFRKKIIEDFHNLTFILIRACFNILYITASVSTLDADHGAAGINKPSLRPILTYFQRFYQPCRHQLSALNM